MLSSFPPIVYPKNTPSTLGHSAATAVPLNNKAVVRLSRGCPPHTAAPDTRSPWCNMCSALLDWAILADDGEAL